MDDPHDQRAELDERIDPGPDRRVVVDRLVVERAQREHGPRADGPIEQRRADVETVALRARVVRVIQHETRAAAPAVRVEVSVEVREPHGGVHRRLVLPQEPAPPAEERRLRACLWRRERALPREPAGGAPSIVSGVVPGLEPRTAAIAVLETRGLW
jgi:hypothetical protein